MVSKAELIMYAVIALAFILYVAFKWFTGKKEEAKALIRDAAFKAEQKFMHGDNLAKVEWVVGRVKALLPPAVQIIINEKVILRWLDIELLQIGGGSTTPSKEAKETLINDTTNSVLDTVKANAVNIVQPVVSRAINEITATIMTSTDIKDPAVKTQLLTMTDAFKKDITNWTVSAIAEYTEKEGFAARLGVTGKF